VINELSVAEDKIALSRVRAAEYNGIVQVRDKQPSERACSDSLRSLYNTRNI
jgi:hypothetical protein